MFLNRPPASGGEPARHDRGVVFAKKVVQPARDYKIPQRKFLFILPDDTTKAKELIEEHAANVADKAAKKKPGG